MSAILEIPCSIGSNGECRVFVLEENDGTAGSIESEGDMLGC